MKTLPVGIQLFHADGRTEHSDQDRYDEVNIRFSQNFANAFKTYNLCQGKDKH